jgi:hypothetical protein
VTDELLAPDDEWPADFGSLRTLARTITDDDRVRAAPPADLWDRIATEALDPSLESVGEPSPVAEVGGVAPVIDLAGRSRRRPRGTWLLAAAAAVAAVVVLGVWAYVGGQDEVVGTADLAALGEVGSGRAELLDDHGTIRLHVELDEVDAGDDAYLELWMIQSTEPLRLVSLGPVRGDGTYDLPPGLDPASFPVVDVSIEHFDGDASHSGESIVRGELQL